MDKATKVIREAAVAGVSSWKKTFLAVQLAMVSQSVASVEFNRNNKEAVSAEFDKVTKWATDACKGIAGGYDSISKYVKYSASIMLVPECATTIETGKGDKKTIRNLDAGCILTRRDLVALSQVANEALGRSRDNTEQAKANAAKKKTAEKNAKADPVAIAKEHEKAKVIEKKAIATAKANLLQFREIVAMAFDGHHDGMRKVLEDTLAAQGYRVIKAEILEAEVASVDRKAERAAATAARVAKAKAEAAKEQKAAAQA